MKYPAVANEAVRLIVVVVSTIRESRLAGELQLRHLGQDIQWCRSIKTPEDPMAILEVSAHLTVRPGQLEGFKKQAAECIRITKEKDTQTLRYDWFLSSDGTTCEVREAYSGPEGLIDHNTHILEARTKLFKDYADNHFMPLYGEQSQPPLDLLKKHSVGFTWFSFLEGLDSFPSRLHRATHEAQQAV